MHCVIATWSWDQHEGSQMTCILTLAGILAALQELDNSVVGAVLDRPHQVQAVHLHPLLPDHGPLLQGREGLTGDHLVAMADCLAGIPATAGHG